MGRMTSPTPSSARPEDLSRLVELEGQLAARLEAARREAREIVARAEAQTAAAGEQARLREAASRRDLEEKAATDLTRRLQAAEAEGRERAGRFLAVSEERVKELGVWVVGRLVEGNGTISGPPA